MDMIIRTVEDGKQVVKTGERLTVAESSDAMKEIIEALKPGDPVVLDITELYTVDAAGLQVLCAGHRTAQKLGQEFSIAGEPSEGFLKAFALAGFKRHTGCKFDQTCSCLWAAISKQAGFCA